MIRFKFFQKLNAFWELNIGQRLILRRTKQLQFLTLKIICLVSIAAQAQHTHLFESFLAQNDIQDQIRKLSVNCRELDTSQVENPKEFFLSYNSQSKLLIEGERALVGDAGDAAIGLNQKVSRDVVLVSKQESHSLEFVDGLGQSIAKIAVEGDPVSPQIYTTQTASQRKLRCAFDRKTTNLIFESMITDPKVIEGIQHWKQWLSKRTAPCAEELDSVGYFQAKAGQKIALVLHGVASNPKRMNEIIKVLVGKGYNVIAPRLARHFTENLRELDFSTESEWVHDASQTFAIAQKFGDQVTLAGFSLGGLLSGKLALRHQDHIERMILFAPAWRVDMNVSLGTTIGNWFNISLNDWEHTPPACQESSGYVPSRVGRIVEALSINTETEEFGTLANPSEALPSVFSKIQIPYLMFTTPNDEAVQTPLISEICNFRSIVCKHVSVPSRKHTTLIDDLNAISDEKTENKSMKALMLEFLDGKYDWQNQL